jgi:hypothetical protein
MSSASKQYYDSHPEAKRKKKAYDTKYHKAPKARKYRSELNKANRKAGTYGNGDALDASHSSNGKSLRKEAQSKNRARNRPAVRATKAPKGKSSY